MVSGAAFYILMALVGELGFMTISILAKRLRNRGISTLSLIAAYGMTLPVWIAAAAFLSVHGEIHFSPAYLLCIAAWLGTCFFLNFGSIYITRFQSLSEGTGYRFGFSTLIALAIDLLVFGTEFHPSVLIVIAMLFTGGIFLHLSREKAVEHQNMKIPLPKRLGFIFIVSLAEVATYALFKYGAGLQDSVLFHNALSQALMFSVFLAAGGRVLHRDYKGGQFPVIYLVALFALMIVAAVADGFAIAGLPVTLFIMFSLIRAACFAVHDIKSGELPLTWSSGFALVLIAAGIASTFMVKEL